MSWLMNLSWLKKNLCSLTENNNLAKKSGLTFQSHPKSSSPSPTAKQLLSWLSTTHLRQCQCSFSFQNIDSKAPRTIVSLANGPGALWAHKSSNRQAVSRSENKYNFVKRIHTLGNACSSPKTSHNTRSGYVCVFL